MFVGFFFELRQGGVPVSLKEYLTLLEAVQKGVAGYDIEHFYYLARAALVKDERHVDRFDRVFAKWFEGIAGVPDPFQRIPDEWLKKMGERLLTDEEKAKIQAMGGWEELLETLRKRLAEQQERHQGGSKWVGTGGTSPFGAWGYNPMGVRIGQPHSRHRSAVKVWDKREFKDFDDSRELGTRNMKVALRKLRKLTREGREEELDLPGTIRATARNAGWLDLKMQPERENQVKVLLFLDVGGSMDDHVRHVDELFSAARSEFKHLEHFYFHNCLYERVWRDNSRRFEETIPTREVLRTYGPDYRVIFVGDASMSPYEITEPGGSVEHWNEESGDVWLRRVLATWDRVLWINPVQQDHWRFTYSIGMLRGLFKGRMVPLTVKGIEDGLRHLKH
ncbi:MAG: VWA domain-containing protein [Planctomycetota bacterium]|nr:VWA domain-containing protein [Planctomycetota bacterium]